MYKLPNLTYLLTTKPIKNNQIILINPQLMLLLLLL